MKTSTKQSAFTLIEVLVSMLVLAIGLLCMAAITVVVLRSNSVSQQTSEATNVATDLMDQLKRLDWNTLSAVNCIGTNVISPATNCSVLTNSGLSAVANAFYPSSTNSNCAIPNVLISGQTTGTTFDWVSANNLAESASGNFATTATICDNNVSGVTMPSRTYLRYYRIYSPNSGGQNATDRTIAVVVLWKDKFGKWRNVRFSTTRSQ